MSYGKCVLGRIQDGVVIVMGLLDTPRSLNAGKLARVRDG